MQFKKGDWVTREESLPYQLADYHFECKSNYYFSKLRKWQPKLNDWLWHKLLNKLVQYKGPNSDEPTQHWFYCPDFSKPTYSITTCSTLDCEPFIGTLPTYIKEH